MGCIVCLERSGLLLGVSDGMTAAEVPVALWEFGMSIGLRSL